MSTESQPDKVTVVVPTYNRVELLKACVHSVLSQTHANLELIIVDDGSSDSTWEWLSSLSDSRVRAFRHERQGAQVARNRGMFEAAGSYITFLDDDDLWHPRKLQKQLEMFQADRQLDGVVCQTVWFRDWPGDHNMIFNRLKDGDPLTRFLRLDVVWQTAASLWSIDFARRVGSWDERLTSGQDLDFHTRCLCLEPKLAYIEEVLNFFREHPGWRITKDRKEEHPANAFYAMETAHRLLRSRGLLTRDRGLGLASTVMRQSRTLAFYGDWDLAKRSLEIARDAHPSLFGKAAISLFLTPITRMIVWCRPVRPLARLLRKSSQMLMVATRLEQPRVEWWQKFPFTDAEAIASWQQEVLPRASV